MKYKWLNQKNNYKLIVFFNGWGMDESIVSNLAYEDFDVLMIYDYNSLDFDIKSLVSVYPAKYLIAWSMGVMIASLYDIEYISKTAINGTLKPIDDTYGIPIRIYNLTIKGFSPIGAKKFIKSMFQETSTLPIINRNFENQKLELNALLQYKANMNFKYDRVIISSGDKIIPTKNQERFWNTKANIISGHCPFNQFSAWGELL